MLFESIVLLQLKSNYFYKNILDVVIEIICLTLNNQLILF